jgi:murein DD-endopeptidase MepM/ murein hydrolase activator NlpD
MDLLWNPFKLTGLIGAVVIVILLAVVVTGVLACWAMINQLPWGHEAAFVWFVGELDRPVGVCETGVLTDEGVAVLGLDPARLEEWFGGHVTSGFHDPTRDNHSGVDFSLTVGNPIRSTWGGTVTFASWSDRGYGNLVIVQSGEWEMYYGHLSGFNVDVGDSVDTGSLVGLSGNTGVSTGPHLHYEVRHAGAPVDPVSAPTDPVGDPAGRD